MAGSPISLHPAPGAGFDAPFDMLSACHERVERMLQLLELSQRALQGRDHGRHRISSSDEPTNTTRIRPAAGMQV